MEPRSTPAHRVPAAGLGLAALVVLLGVAAHRSRPPQPGPSAAAPPRPAPRDPSAGGLAGLEEQVRRSPDEAGGYHRLAVAYMSRQRETGDPELYRRAEAMLRAAERRGLESYTTRKLLAWVLAGQHRFDEALVLARECRQANPHDDWNYGVIGDALTEQGDYDGAVAAVQKMADLRPGPLSYARAAHLRRLHGDPDGALELYALALEATSPRERESRAWLHTQAGDIRFESGRLKEADAGYAAALRSVPGYHLAEASRARLRASQGRLAEAAEVYRRVLERVHRPDWMAALGDVYLAQGRREAAEELYRSVETYLERRLDDPTADATHQLAQFLADRGRRPERALRLAREEAADARDIKALDTLAWALYHRKRYAEAWSASRRALRLGTRDPKLLYHAGMIGLALPAYRQEGTALLRRAVALNPSWDVLDAPTARRALKDSAVALTHAAAARG